MAKKAVSRETNQENLTYFCKILEGIEHFVFFGTMLGLERDGGVIEGDDDIDFYVPVEERFQLIARLEDNGHGVLKDRWNFHGQVANLDMILHVPSELVYPLQKQEFFGNQVNLPHNSRALCKFLYGPKWHQRLQKGTAYRTVIWRNKPLVFVGKYANMQYTIAKALKKIRRLVISEF
jgi:hypothetical protein